MKDKRLLKSSTVRQEHRALKGMGGRPPSMPERKGKSPFLPTDFCKEIRWAKGLTRLVPRNLFAKKREEEREAQAKIFNRLTIREARRPERILP